MGTTKKSNGKLNEIWFDGRQISLDRQDIWGLINNSNINTVVVTFAQRQEGRYPVKTQLITEIKDETELDQTTGEEVILSANQEILSLAKERGYRTCLSLFIDDREALDVAWEVAKNYDYVVVDFDLPTNIPLELIIARLQNDRTILLKRESNWSESSL